MTDDALPPVLPSLLAALQARPDDATLRLHVAELLLTHGRPAEAAAQCAAVLAVEPGSTAARQMLNKAAAWLDGRAEGEAPPAPRGHADPGRAPEADAFSWHAAEEDVSGIVEPAFVEDAPDEPPPDVERSEVRLSDVGGLEDVKRRIDMAFLAPMRHPHLRRMYGRSLPGGLLLYGPPGCGKTFLARAVAGELDASFYAVSLADVLDMWIGASERNLRAVFDTARRSAPCVLFLDEVDAIGHKRANLRTSAAMRGTVNQLLTEMDSVRGHSRGDSAVFVLGATNQPWDVDTALMRPGRFDRLLLVAPPDKGARDAIVRYHLRNRPLEGIDVAKIVKKTEHYSGADLAHLCDSAAEFALSDSVRNGQARPIRMGDIERALAEVKPSTGAWLEDARTVVMFANHSGRFDDLLAYLKQRGMA